MSQQQTKFYTIVFGTPSAKHYSLEEAQKEADAHLAKGKVRTAFIFELVERRNVKMEIEAIEVKSREPRIGEMIGNDDNVRLDNDEEDDIAEVVLDGDYVVGA